ncbi:MAG TPA: hypothetical protein ENN32_03255 [Chloroflexi bacterium]|nr:hypothetical protein [Chloroflexota bacterium]
MKYMIVFPEIVYDDCRTFLLRDPHNEQFGYLLAGVNEETDQYVKLLVHTFLPAESREDLEYQSTGGICPSPKFQMRVYSMCKREGYHLIDVHSHPFDNSAYVRFSGIDDRYEFGSGREGVFGFTAMWNPGMYHASIVFGQNSLDARIYRADMGRAVPIDEVRVFSRIIPTGARLRQRQTIAEVTTPQVASSTTAETEQPTEEKKTGNDDVFGDGSSGGSSDALNTLYSRQILAFGKAGQEELANTTVAVIGAGGLGSIVVEILARLGIREIICVDDDVIEASNLSRVLGSTAQDVENHTAKVHALGRHVKTINPEIIYTPVMDTILNPQAQAFLKRADFIISGTDTHSSRLVLNQFAVQYLIPYIDLGFGMETDEQRQWLVSAGGKVITFIPGSWCFHCLGEIDQRELQLELMRKEDRERQIARGYISGVDIPNPSVIFLNMTVAALGICEFLNLLAPFKERNLYIFYDMLATRLWSMKAKPKLECPVCSREAERLGRGDLLALEDLRDAEARSLPEN